MEIRVTRKPTASNKYTPGIMELLDDKSFRSFTLEDPIRKVKIKGDTAIPAGRYEVILNMSNRFGKYMPLLLNVPGFEGVRIHAGNKKEDTEGCILVGYEDSSDGFMGLSVKAFNDLMARLSRVEKKEKIWITIV